MTHLADNIGHGEVVESVAKRARLLLLLAVVGGSFPLARQVARHPERIRAFRDRQAIRGWVT